MDVYVLHALPKSESKNNNNDNNKKNKKKKKKNKSGWRTWDTAAPAWRASHAQWDASEEYHHGMPAMPVVLQVLMGAGHEGVDLEDKH